METIYAIIESGVVVNCIVADEWPGGVNITALDPRPGIGWTYDGQVFAAPPAPEPEPEPVVEHPDGAGPFLTQYAFDMRFSLMERVAIERAAMVEPGMTEAEAITATAVRVNLDRAKKATYINPMRAETRSGVLQFVTLNLLTEARALEILDAPILPREEYRQ